MLRKILPIVVLALAVGGFLVLRVDHTVELHTEVVEKEWLVETTSATSKTASPTLRLYGRVQSPSKSKLSSVITADVLEVLALAGNRVTQNDVLVKLGDGDVRNTLLQRKAELSELNAQIVSENQRYTGDLAAVKIEREMARLSRRSVTRARKLAKSRAGSEATLDDALSNQQQRSLSVSTRKMSISEHGARLAQIEARKARAMAALELAEHDLERTEIVAPFDGRITAMNVSPGNRVRTGDVVVELFDTSVMEIKTQVPSSRLRIVRSAVQDNTLIQGKVLIDDAQIPVTLDRLGGEVSQGGVTAFFRIDSERHSDLELGRIVVIHISLPPIDNVIELPFATVYGGNVVYRVVDDRIESVRVERVGETLNEDGRKLLVRSEALAPDDQIVTSLLPGVVEGLKVRSQ